LGQNNHVGPQQFNAPVTVNHHHGNFLKFFIAPKIPYYACYSKISIHNKFYLLRKDLLRVKWGKIKIEKPHQ
jgi:hypothetical protein